MLPCQRHLFQLPAGTHYLNCAYMSPLLASVEAAGVAGMRRKRDPGTIGPSDFFEELARVRSLGARLLGGADPARLAIIPSASYGLSTVARNLPVRAGGTIVVAAEQFPSNVYAWRRLAADKRLELRTVPVAAQSDPTGVITGAIDKRTAVVAVGSVHWVDGTGLDLQRIGAAARTHGAALVVDATQTLGAVPFDLAAIRPAAVVAAAYKWLLGPYSIGLAWFGPEFDDGVPLEDGWLARPESDDFGGLVMYRDGYRPGAARYDVGEASNFILLPMLRAALEQVLAWDVTRIAEYCGSLTARILQLATTLGLGVTPAETRSPHIVGIRLPGDDIRSRLAEACRRREVSISFRGNAVRISPHVYNDEDDLTVLEAALHEAISTR